VPKSEDAFSLVAVQGRILDVRDRGLGLSHLLELLGCRDLAEMPEHPDEFDVRPERAAAILAAPSLADDLLER
jgi:hypothetical protein